MLVSVICKVNGNYLLFHTKMICYCYGIDCFISFHKIDKHNNWHYTTFPFSYIITWPWDLLGTARLFLSQTWYHKYDNKCWTVFRMSKEHFQGSQRGQLKIYFVPRQSMPDKIYKWENIAMMLSMVSRCRYPMCATLMECLVMALTLII